MDLEQQLRAALAPTTPGPQVRAAVKLRLAEKSHRGSVNRWVLVGAVLALGAAAAMLAMRLLEPAATTVIAESVHVLDVPPGDAPDAPVSVDTTSTETTSATQDSEAPPVGPAVQPFTVNVPPLKSDVDDPSRKAALETVYTTLVDGLRDVPGLTLVDATATADYRLTLEGNAAPASATAKDDFWVNMAAEQIGPAGRVLRGYHTGATGEVAPACASPSSMDTLSYPTCADPIGVARRLLVTLRKSVFPVDPQLQRDLRARLFDQTLEPGERRQALADLGSLGRGSAAMGAFPAGLRDPAVVRAAIQLASVAPDPATRAQVWYTLRGSGDPTLLRPLVAALRTDADQDTRVQALATLVADFATDPQARSALETAGVGDPDPMVRALAQRALGAESVWTDYVLASLKDTGQSPTDRIKAFFYAYGLPTTRMYAVYSADGRILRALDDAGMRALAEVLPRAAADSKAYASASFTLVSELSYMKHPAITDMLLDSLDASEPWLDRSFAVESLRRRTDDPRVREALAKIARDDADPQVRALAVKPLGAEEKTVDVSALPPRLGVMTDYVKAAPGVPTELVGKLAVTRMSTGSPADHAGMKEADILLEINGTPITSGPQLIEVLDGLSKDVDVGVLVSRNGQTLRLTARF